MKNRGLLQNQFSRFKSFSAISLAALLLTLNLCGSYAFIGEFKKDMAKEASLFNRSALSSSVQPAAKSQEDLSGTMVIPLGTAFGIKLYTDGVIVTALSDVATKKGNVCPARQAGIKPGDFIVGVNKEEVRNNNSFSALMAKYAQGEINLTIKRGDKEFDTVLTPILDGNVLRCGMWIKDSAAGIGTLTFANAETGDFAGLGHGICDGDTGGLMSLRGGEPCEIAICDTQRGEKQKPGKINGFFKEDGALGVLYDNNETGIYGRLDKIPPKNAVPLGLKEELKTGAAKILVTIDNEGVKSFDVQIESINKDKNKTTKNLVVRITDKELLEATGGIVQGMSGTPIIQDGKLVAAITHVFLDDPTRGYGIYAETMYRSLH